MPGSIFDSARNLTVHAYLLTKEKGDIDSAASLGNSINNYGFIFKYSCKSCSKEIKQGKLLRYIL